MATTDTVSNTTPMFLTPQARDDLFDLTEDQVTGSTAGIFFIDVLANDAGGAAKTLFAATEGAEADFRTISATTIDGTVVETAAEDAAADQIAIADLATRDAFLITNSDQTMTGWQTLESGARFGLTREGQIAYDTTPIAAKIDALGKGEIFQEQITYSIRMSNGTLSVATVTITITGKNDGPAFGTADVSAKVIEDVSVGQDGRISDSGTIAFTDVDVTDIHTVSAAAKAGNLTDFGEFTANISTSATGVGAGVVTWSFSVENAAVQYLAKGETLTQTYTVTIDDGEGGVIAKDVVVEIVGTNDRPEIKLEDLSGKVTEDDNTGDLTDSGEITFTDTDLADTHVATVATPPSTYLGEFSVGIVQTEGAGTLTWSFSVANEAVQHLGAKDVLQQSYTITLDDQNGGTVEKVVTVEIKGTNDRPVIVTEVLSGAVKEDESSPLTKSGTITFTDLDLSDDHIAVLGNVPSGYLGTFGASVTEKDGAGTVTWTFSVPNEDVQYLGADEKVEQTYTITLDDQNGGTVERVVTVVIQGTNDGPVIGTEELDGAVTEDSGADPLTAAGTITFTDEDLTDEHIVSVAAVPETYLGSFDATVESADGAGTVSWSFSVDNALVQHLGADEKVEQTYTITLDDQNGGTVERVVTVVIQGTNDGPVIGTGDFEGEVTEDVGVDALLLKDSGTIAFTDLDVTDSHDVTVDTVPPGYLGSFTASVSSSGGSGAITWEFAVPNSDVQHLGKDESISQTYTILLSDGHGDPVTETVTVVIQGTNDGPVVTAADLSGAVTEDTAVVNGKVTDSGLIAFTDADIHDAHTASVTPNGTGYLGELSAVVTDASTGDGSGQVTWTFSVDNSLLQSLNTTDVRTQSYTVKISDGTDFVERTVVVTINGQNEPVVIVYDENKDGMVGTSLSPATNQADIIYGTTSRDVVDGAQGGDIIYGGPGDDELSGGQDVDEIWGGSGNDVLKGGVGADKLYGGSGNDRIFGDQTPDIIDGGTGNDVMTGDEGNDVFVFRPMFGNDRITDFDDGKDQFDVSHLGITLANFASMVTITQQNADVLVTIGTNTFLIETENVLNVTSADFLF